MKEIKNDSVRNDVRDTYSTIAVSGESGCGCAPSTCCTTDSEQASMALGYSYDELSSIPTDANLGLGCGNPQAIANLKKGETVIDLGSGAGIDCFLSATQVGDNGRVIGVDMTPEMLSKARTNAENGGYKNVEFRLGEIENLPVANDTADVIISNCVINLSPDKQQVYDDSYRALKPGGRLAISDVVTTAKLPEEILNSPQLHSACISGASSIEEIEEMLGKSGFVNVKIDGKDLSSEYIREWAPGTNVEQYILSASIEAEKPAN